MKRILRTILLFAAFGIIFISCEPNLWENILAAPGPVENLNVTHNPGVDDITITYDVPASSVNEFQGEDDWVIVWFYYRLTSGGDEVFFSEQHSIVGGPSGDMDFTLIELTAENYEFIVYIVDREYQRSEPAVSPNVNW